MIGTRRERGLTLVELMVAMALMTVLTGTIIMIFSQAQTIYGRVDAQVKVYQYARTALDTMERDLANVVKTADMDFYNDGLGGPKNGHFDLGEQLNGGVGLDLAEEVRLKLAQPPGHYHYGFTLRQPKFYPDYTYPTDSTKTHAHDSIYFKTITQYQGLTCAAIVEYAMVDMDRLRPKLQKRLWRVSGLDASNKIQINDTPGSTAPIEQDLCLYVTDVQFQVFILNNRHGEDPTNPGEKFTPGRFYTAQDLVDAKVDPLTGNAPFPPFKNYWGGAANRPYGSDDYMIMCYYDENHDPTGPDIGKFLKVDNGLFHTDKAFGFPMLVAGDKIFIQPVDPSVGLAPNDYTLKTIKLVTGIGERFQFVEPISTTGPNFPASADARYRAGWLPPAVRVQLKIKDEKAKELRTISRTFKILSSG
jgi:prepilin-type N-terminal cleavage/methylation domain-containing protein